MTDEELKEMKTLEAMERDIREPDKLYIHISRLRGIINSPASAVTDEEVQRAIDDFESAYNNASWIDSDYVENPIKSDSCRIAITALRQMQGWIPVSERLPESGVHVLFGCEVRPSKRKYVCDGYYAATKTITGTNYDECAAEYDEDKDEYFLVEGFYEVIKNWDDFSSVVISDFVTHWMPLPSAPEVKGEKE